MTTIPELGALIADIKEGEPTREMNDRVLLALGWTKHKAKPPAYSMIWTRPDGRQLWEAMCPSPLSNLQDATLAVPEGCIWGVYSSGYVEINWPDGDKWRLLTAKVPGNPAIALTLAGLKARLAIMEAEDG